MNVVSGVVLYTLIWWTVLFAVLPIGARPQSDAETPTGGWRGTPEKPRLLIKALATTLLSALIWLGCYFVIRSDWLSFRHGWLALPEH